MWNGKNKAITLSYDDGVLQDKKLVKILDYYGVKATFNINSGMLYNECIWINKNVTIIRMTADELINNLSGHEIAVHGLTHTDLRNDDYNQTERQLIGDKVNLERIFNRKIYGMAYPGGFCSENARKVCEKFGIKYARLAGESKNFEVPSDLLNFNGTVHHSSPDFLDLTKKFLELETDKPVMLYVWGHSYEFDIDNNWNIIEDFCKAVSGNKDIFFGTNHEVLSPFYR